MEQEVKRMFNGIEFAHPGFFWLFIIIPVMIAYYIWREQKLQGSLSVSAVKGFSLQAKSIIPRLRHSGIVLRSLAIAALIAGACKAAILIKLAK